MDSRTETERYSKRTNIAILQRIGGYEWHEGTQHIKEKEEIRKSTVK